MEFIKFVIEYLTFSLACLFILAIIAKYDMRMYPLCPNCRDNTHTRRRGLFDPLAECRIHGWF